MRSATLRINHLLENLEEDDYDKAISYIEFLISVKKKKQVPQNKADVESIVASLTGAIPDTGKTLEEYRNERLSKYEISD